MRTSSEMSHTVAFHPRVTTIGTRTRRIETYGRRAVVRIPGISPGRSRPRDGRTRGAAFGSRRRPPLSSFGARLRRRLPQYGHSVMYGDTSEPQLLQTTKRSGLLAMDRRLYAPPAVAARLFGGGLDDLAHDLGQVVVGLVDHDLPLGAVSVLEDVADRVELIGRSEVL